MIRSIISYSIAAIIPIFGLAAQEPQVEPKANIWTNFIQKTGANSKILSAWNYQNDYFIDPSEVAAVLRAESKFKLTHPTKFENEVLTEIDFSKASLQSISRSENVMGLKRDSRMVENIINHLKTSPDNEFLIIVLGQSHGFDLFFNLLHFHPSLLNQVLFVRGESRKNTPVSNDLLESIGISFSGKSAGPSRILEDRAGGASRILGLARLWLFNQEKKFPVTSENLFGAQQSIFPKAVVYLDTHGLRDLKTFRLLPKAQDLKDARIERILILSESLAQDTPHSLADIENVSRVGPILTYNYPNQVAALQSKVISEVASGDFKLSRKDFKTLSLPELQTEIAWELNEGPSSVTLPSFFEAAQAGRTYQQAGIDVRVEGVEPFLLSLFAVWVGHSIKKIPPQDQVEYLTRFLKRTTEDIRALPPDQQKQWVTFLNSELGKEVHLKGGMPLEKINQAIQQSK